VTLHGGGLQKGEGLYLALGTEFVMFQKSILGHIEVDTTLMLSKAKQKKNGNIYRAQTWVQAHLIIGAMRALTSGVFMVKKWVGRLA
jgi:hypothetical protein